MQRLKKIAFLVAKPGMADVDFRAYWRETHGPVVAGSPGYARWRLRYAQNHVAGRGPEGDFGYAGMAEFWLPGEAPNEDEFSLTGIYRDRIRPDEMNFIDMDRTVSMSAFETVLKPGIGAVKVVFVSQRAAGMAPDDYRRRFAAEHAAPLLRDPEFGARISGWRVDHVVDGSFRLPGGRPAAAAVDSVEAMRFASPDAMKAAFASPGWRARPSRNLFASVQSFLAEELVFFDATEDGQLRTPAGREGS